ncbi:MAG: hypothetical protein JRN68_08155 [Nitrososphaerota archaeon]|nr:hypothetical protein [Nitrososphaerota archaeon]
MQTRTSLVIPIVAIVVVGSLLVYFDVKTGGISNLEGGSNIGYVPAVLTWVAFIASVAAMGGFCTYVVATAGPPYVRSSITKRNVAIGIVIILAIFLILQFGLHTFAPLESGIASGEAPISLTWIAAVLTLLANLGFVIFVSKYRSNGKGGEAANLGFAVISEGSQAESRAAEGRRMKTKTIDVVLGDPQDAAMLSGNFDSSRAGGYNRDAIQTRNNIAEWIVTCVSIEKKLAKKTLESRFSEQFPRTLWPLFNSVVYDLVYQNRLVLEGERGSELISLKERPTAER